MALPAIAAAAARIRGGASKALKGGAGGARKKPSAFGPAMIMLLLAAFFDLANIGFGILDFLGIGLVLSPIVNGVATIFIGGWLWIVTGSFPVKRGLGPLLGNSIPLAKFIPWWVISVATSLDWRGGSAKEQARGEQQVQQENQQFAGGSPQPAKNPA